MILEPSPLLAPAFAGGCLGVGVFAVRRALRPVGLAASVGRLHRVDRSGSSWTLGVSERLGHRGRDADLAVCGRSREQHAAAQLAVALVLAAVAGALVVLARVGGSPPPPAAAALLVTGAFVVGFVLQDRALRTEARRRRRDLRHALSAYLDLVNVLLAGGAGFETALAAAADAGDGWAFAELRRTLARARAARRSVWGCLSELGEAYAVDDLVELGASVQLAGEHGARVAASLAARAEAMRDRLLAQIEADAQAASERMGLPTVLMFAGFLVLLGYPAVQIILGST